MDRSLRAATGLLLWAAVCFPAPAASQTSSQSAALPSIRRVQVLHNAGQVEIEIEASERIVPRANVLTGPDRLVLDFVNAVPGAQLRNQSVSRGEVKSVRVGLFSANPPVTRLVVDLSGPQNYQVFPSGRTVIVKMGGAASVQASAPRSSSPTSSAALVNTNYASHATLSSLPERTVVKPPLEVSFQKGLLSISSNKATLSQVLFAIHERTGAEIAIPAGAEQEQVVAEIGPSPAAEALASLLNGSKFNFLILSSSEDSSVLDRVILSARPEGPMPTPPRQARTSAEDDDEAAAEPQPKSAGPAAVPASETTEKATGDPGHPNEDQKAVSGNADTPQ
jgi:AMIN domain